MFMRSTFSVCFVPQTAAVGGGSLAGAQADRQRHPASRLWPAGQARIGGSHASAPGLRERLSYAYPDRARQAYLEEQL
jgi:hypothetical protein